MKKTDISYFDTAILQLVASVVQRYILFSFTLDVPDLVNIGSELEIDKNVVYREEDSKFPTYAV